MLREATHRALTASWRTVTGLHSLDDILAWVSGKNESTFVSINKITLAECQPWFLDKSIQNPKGSFFAIAGLRYESTQIKTGDTRTIEQPIIIQDEIGYLGIICKPINGVMHFLMQAKIEPGNSNKVQISPTIQATLSNFTQKHGGRKPVYLDYFANRNSNYTIVDQIQSEQSSRFLGKRNRNVMLELNENESIEASPSHMWVTLGQLVQLMRTDNLVNMDTRTVLSCIPWQNTSSQDGVNKAFVLLNDFKMFHRTKRNFLNLSALHGWKVDPYDISGGTDAAFKVIFCAISIEGREVQSWNQPLFEAQKRAHFGLIAARSHTGALEFLVRLKPEIGCFDQVELGPTLQIDDENDRQGVPENDENCERGMLEAPGGLDELSCLFQHLLSSRSRILFDVVLSEEGGRFYHEQNRNTIIFIDKNDVPQQLLKESFALWLDFSTLNSLVQHNNVLNIQLRNLLSLLDWKTVYDN
jgi:oxidase EvaA